MDRTNANSAPLSEALAHTKRGTFAGLIITKKGLSKGGKTYGNDRVHVTVISGFSYMTLVQKSLSKLDTITVEKVQAKSPDLSDFSIASAIQELRESFEATLNGTSESTTDHVYEPLVLDGVEIRGSRVYRCAAGKVAKCHCRGCTGNPKAPIDGTIYLQGLLINSTIMETAPNGPPPTPNSSEKTLAKNAIRRMLPIGHYVSYCLEPGQDWILRVGGNAKIK